MAVASGKGGTGKTFISLNLFSSLSDAVLADCDVEEPNDHLFLNYHLKKISDVTTTIPQINSSCQMCGICVDTCRYHALVEMIDTIYVTEELCHGCGLCTKICPFNAIVERKIKIGEISYGKNEKNGSDFYQGELRIGQAMSSPLIKELIKIIPYDGSKNVILDAPPGTACPVITTISYADFVLLVTEPTPYAFENLKMTIEMIKQLKIPMGIVLNKSQTQFNLKIYNYSSKEKIPILLEIPFDKKIAEIYARGQILSKEYSNWKNVFRNVWDQINEMLE